MDNKFIKEILNELASMSGYVLFRVIIEWASDGRTGIKDDIVIAIDAIEAIKRAWEGEDNKQIRTVEVEWLTPVECTLK
jgi:hypothetical protein